MKRSGTDLQYCMPNKFPMTVSSIYTGEDKNMAVVLQAKTTVEDCSNPYYYCEPCAFDLQNPGNTALPQYYGSYQPSYTEAYVNPNIPFLYQPRNVNQSQMDLFVDKKSRKNSFSETGTVPPPPTMPIINPIVYSKNQDVGTSDLQYVPSDIFANLNCHLSQPISIPRITVPDGVSSPEHLIPSLVASQFSSVKSSTISSDENTVKDEGVSINSEDSHSENISPSPLASNKDKLTILGFSWDSEDDKFDGVDDIWVKNNPNVL